MQYKKSRLIHQIFRWNLFSSNSKFSIPIDSWKSALESSNMKQATNSHPSQNNLPPNTAPYAGVLSVRPTQAQAGGQVGAAQSDWNFQGSNAQNTQGNTPSSDQEHEKLPPDNSSLVSPVSSAQGDINENSAAPHSGPNGEHNPAPGQVGDAPSSGTNGANSTPPVTSPKQPSGNQGKEVPGAISPPAGGAINPTKAGTVGNSGATAESTGKSVGLYKNPPQPNDVYL